MNNKCADVQADLAAPLLFAYGINRFSYDVAHLPFFILSLAFKSNQFVKTLIKTGDKGR